MEFETIFSDKYGTESTTIFSNGNNLRVKIRGVEFESQTFDDFEPLSNQDPKNFAELFSFNKYTQKESTVFLLQDCSFQVKIPIVISELSREKLEILEVTILIKKVDSPQNKFPLGTLTPISWTTKRGV